MISLVTEEIRDFKRKLGTVYLAMTGVNQEQLPCLRMQYLIDDYQDFITKKR